jgi:hypothetical protein
LQREGQSDILYSAAEKDSSGIENLKNKLKNLLTEPQSRDKISKLLHSKRAKQSAICPADRGQCETTASDFLNQISDNQIEMQP